MDDKLAIEEARRLHQHESVKAGVESEVKSDIQTLAARKTEADLRQAENVAGRLRERALGEVVETEHEADRSRSVARISQVVDYVFCIVYALLGIRFALSLMAANSGAGFVRFIRAITDPLYAPFKGIVASPSTDGGATLMLPLVIAIVVYFLLHLGINGLLRLLAQRKTQI
jgi:hypothetical protein